MRLNCFRAALVYTSPMARRALASFVLLGTLTAACGSSAIKNPGSTRESGQSNLIEKSFAGKNRCNPQDHTRPFVIEWDGTDISSFESRATTDVVFVRYEGCNLQVLDGCTNDSIRGSLGSYGAVDWTSGAVEKVDILNEDELYAKLPLTPRYVPIDPSEYGSPDPADFADPSSGISGLLLELDGAKKDGEKRVDGEVLTTYTGTLPGSLVDPIIPSADKAGTYQTAVGIDEHGRIATLRVTGSFFAHDGDVTYDLAFDDYDKSVTISAP